MSAIPGYHVERFNTPTPYQRDDRKPGFITLAAHLRAAAIYHEIYGRGQSAARLAERGGFGEEELDVFYPEWRNHIVQKTAKP
jgi:hypothetical protein